MKLESITREELEKERIEVVNPQNIHCKYDTVCTRAGQYSRCYLDWACNCPFYRTYQAQEEGK